MLINPMIKLQTDNFSVILRNNPEKVITRNVLIIYTTKHYEKIGILETQ
jgi:hypothetical protein